MIVMLRAPLVTDLLTLTVQLAQLERNFQVENVKMNVVTTNGPQPTLRTVVS